MKKLVLIGYLLLLIGICSCAKPATTFLPTKQSKNHVQEVKLHESPRLVYVGGNYNS